MRLVSHADITAARSTMTSMLGAAAPVRTPLLPVPDAEPARPLWLKPESLQPVGAFKIRGALHATAALDDTERARGVVTYSSGNHARAVAHAARVFGVPATVVVPHTAPAVKVEAARALGAEIVPVEVAERESRAHRIATERGAKLIPPFDDPAVIAGQGTAGLEIAEDVDADTVLVPVSGGGLISGVGVAIKSARPGTRVIGVEPELAADARESLRSGSRCHWAVESRTRTVADGLTAEPSELTFAHMREVVDDIVTVGEEEIGETVGHLARACHLVAEPSGAVAVAAHRYRADDLGPGTSVAIVTGGNIDTPMLVRLLGG